jgi:hypothetical protein
VATITLGANRTITEHGVFSASSAGTLWDRSVFSGLPLNFGEAIQFSYDLTLNDGG